MQEAHQGNVQKQGNKLEYPGVGFLLDAIHRGRQRAEVVLEKSKGKMTNREREIQILLLQEEINFNEKIHCYRVAARIQREIEKLRKEKANE